MTTYSRERVLAEFEKHGTANLSDAEVGDLVVVPVGHKIEDRFLVRFYNNSQGHEHVGFKLTLPKHLASMAIEVWLNTLDRYLDQQ